MPLHQMPRIHLSDDDFISETDLELRVQRSYLYQKIYPAKLSRRPANYFLHHLSEMPRRASTLTSLAKRIIECQRSISRRDKPGNSCT